MTAGPMTRAPKTTAPKTTAPVTTARGRTEPVSAVDRRDVALAGLCAAAALVAYVRTLAPGVTSDVDTAMFQFIGRVLGVAHNPGYPLYALVTWPIGQLPFGELAWRINLFSAVMGALAVGATAIAARRLGCSRPAAAFAALGLAAGSVFWSQAIVAEVYTLHLVFVAMLLQSALQWEASRRPRHFYAAVAWLAVGLGHHTTIGALAPALALHAILIDRRFALRLRTIATAAAICVLGLLPYLYVLVRSRDPQAYVESRATTIGALVQVVLGGQFRDRLFTDPWLTLVAERIPDLVVRVLRPDLTVLGLLLAAVGAVWLLRRRPATAVLLLTPVAILTTFVAGYAVVDQPVFLLPVMLCLWLLAARGVDRVVASIVGPTAGPQLRQALALAAGVVALVLPLRLAAHHGPLVDRSRDRAAARHVERLVAALPPRAVIASGDFIADRIVHYELLGRDAAPGRGIALAPRDAPSIVALAQQGATVVAFPGAVDRLRLAGLDFSAVPLPLPDGPLDQVIAELRRGSIVALAIPAAHALGLRPASRRAWPALGLPDGWGGSGHAGHVAVATAGATAEPRTAAGPVARLPLGPGEGPWPGHAGIELEAGDTEAAIRAGGRDLIRTSDGAAVAIWAADGALLRTFVLGPAGGYQALLEPDALSAYPLIGVAESRGIEADALAVDVTPLAGTGSLTASVPAGGTLTLAIEDAGPFAPYVVHNEGDARIDVQPPSAGGPTRLTIAAAPARPASIYVVFGVIPDRLTARLAGGSAPAQVRRASTAGLLRGPDRQSAVIRMTRDDQVFLLGAGWSEVETDHAGPYRWIRGREARLVVPASPRAWRTLTVEAFGPAGDAAATLLLRVGGVDLDPQRLRAGWQAYTWTVPPPVAEALRARSAEVAVIVDGADTAPGVAVASVRFVRDPN
jgi:hypothetical protein